MVIIKMAGNLGSDITAPCDVSSDDEIRDVFVALKKHWDTLDIIIHSVAFAPREALEGGYVEATTREAFLMAHDISSYSFTALAMAARSMLHEGSALLTLTYLGAERVIPHYNVMGVAKASLEANVRYMANDLGPDGIRVNAVSAGPIRTLAAAGIANFRTFLEYGKNNAPLRRNVTINEVGNVAAFLCSDLASAVTGEITYVDCGYNILGMNEN